MMNNKFPYPKFMLLLIMCVLLPSFVWMAPARGEAAVANQPLEGIKLDNLFIPPDLDPSVVDVTYVTYATYGEQRRTRSANIPPAKIDLDNIFTIPTGSNSSIIDGSIVQITPASTWKKGGIWSTSNNFFDLTQDFKSSMYIYFGNRGKDAADGIAFVMHNDSRGTNALSPNNGAGLGVWASQNHNGPYDGIQNSLAVEFDTHINNGGIGEGRFDVDSSAGNHIAWNYPGKTSIYTDYYHFPDFTRKMMHNNLQYTGILSNDTWRRFEVEWNVAKSMLSYQLEGTSKVNIPINVQDVFGSNQIYWGFTGSTGGDYALNQVVFETVPGLVNSEVKETITRDSFNVNGATVFFGDELTYTITAKYLSGKQDWKNIVGQTTINDYVTYVPGSLTLTDRNGTVPLNDALWSGNTLAVNLSDMNADNHEQSISFKVAVNQVSQTTPVAEKTDFRGSNHVTQTSPVNYFIDINQAPKVAIDEAGTIHIKVGQDYEVTGTWQDPDNSTNTLYYALNNNLLNTEELDNGGSTDPVPWNYLVSSSLLQKGENIFQVASRDPRGAYSIAFLNIFVESPPTVTLMDANKEIPVDFGTTYTINGSWSDLDSHAVDLYYAIDSAAPVNFAPGAENSTIKGEEIIYQYTIPADQLTLGMHQIAVYAVDERGWHSNVETVKVNVTGKLVFTSVAENMSFENIKIASQPTISERNNDWDIHVKDTRGTGSPWRLSATLTEEFTDGKGHHLKDALIFVDEHGNETTMELGIPMNVYDDISYDQQEVSIQWEIDRGILLKINPYVYAAEYKGLISWNLVDAP
ncbi:L-type lectin-domain containing protein [Bacillus sp. FJAT-28004]|uniref:L-type lectin-domain containing protein n=1 Tax=Bacillus sp. FJAT-28004 TaxID=1679165 RepID=UPI0006B534FB|nr:L-type lectin-domain containing protein [Bacillus sp. FJAT-28004]